MSQLDLARQTSRGKMSGTGEAMNLDAVPHHLHLGVLMAKRQSIVDRFWSKVDRSGGPDACHPWMTYRTPTGYGRFGPTSGKSVRAHRVAWELTHGPIPSGLQVLHRCDNPSCCNVRHLWLGTIAQNVADRDAKGRGVLPPGSSKCPAPRFCVKGPKPHYHARTVAEGSKGEKPW